ncbi:MAG: hypothetical protein QXI12_10465 [Candidatus Methanomethyliaceae archaeon]
MKATITITADGKISIITQEGTFEGGKDQIKRFLASLSLEGIEIAPVEEKDFEQHRHDDVEHAHAHVHTHNS